MKRFRDRDGVEWDVVLGRESWGVLLALFIDRAGRAATRQAPLGATAHDAAMQELDGMGDAALQALLDRSSVKDEGS